MKSTPGSFSCRGFSFFFSLFTAEKLQLHPHNGPLPLQAEQGQAGVSLPLAYGGKAVFIVALHSSIGTGNRHILQNGFLSQGVQGVQLFVQVLVERGQVLPLCRENTGRDRPS